MNISYYPPTQNKSKCLLLVGGDGDTIEVFSKLSKKIADELGDFQVCTFNFTESSPINSVLEIQVKELEGVCHEFMSSKRFKYLDIWCTSRGAYSTTFLLGNTKFSGFIRHVIMYDPADYYISSKLGNTWSGCQEYLPKGHVVSGEIKNIVGDVIVDVIHLTLRNYGKNGYLQLNYKNRGIDYDNGYPRLNSKMVKSFYDNLPLKNKGKYIVDNTVPHGFVRDGDIEDNYLAIAKQVASALSE